MVSSSIKISQSRILFSSETHFETPITKTPFLSIPLKTSSFVRTTKGSLQIGRKMPLKSSVVVSATVAVEKKKKKKKKRYPGEAKGFVEEMRFVAMKLENSLERVRRSLKGPPIKQ